MKTFSTTLLVAAAIAFAVPATAQEQTPPDTTEVEVQAPDAAIAPDAQAPEETDQPAQPTHDWEFALSPTEKAAGASGTVKVTNDDGAQTFVVETTGLPMVDSLDQEGKDVNAFTVWVVPSKDRVPESTLAGVLTIDPETGAGTLEATTDLTSFGVIVSATADGAPARIGGVPVLTGIPVQSQVQPEPEAGETPASEPEAGEAPAPEAPQTPEVPEPVEEPAEPEAPADLPGEDEPETAPEPEVEPTDR